MSRDPAGMQQPASSRWWERLTGGGGRRGTATRGGRGRVEGIGTAYGPAPARTGYRRPVNPYVVLEDLAHEPAGDGTGDARPATGERTGRKRGRERRRVATRPPASPTVRSGTPTTKAPPGPAGRRGRREVRKARAGRAARDAGVWSGALVALLAGTAVVVAVVAGVAYDRAQEPPEHLGTAWETRPWDLDPRLSEIAGFRDSVDGSAVANHIATPEAWVLVIDAHEPYRPGDRAVPTQVAAVDPGTGTSLWRVDLADVRCADRPTADDHLVCVSREGTGWAAHLIDVATGTLERTWPMPVASVDTVHLGPGGLLVVGESEPRVRSQLSLVGLDGTLAWTTDLADLPDADDLFIERPDDDDVEHTVLYDPVWDDVGELVVLTAGTGMVHVAPDGVVSGHRCWDTAVTADASYCTGSEGTTRYDAAGEALWTAPDVQLVHAPYEPAVRPLHARGDAELEAVDWTSGAIGEPLHRFGTRDGWPHVSGSPEHTFASNGRTVVRLAADRDEVVWATEVDDLSSISRVLVVDDVAVVTGYPFVGLDLATGEELWVRRAAALDPAVIDGRLAVFGHSTVAVHVLP